MTNIENNVGFPVDHGRSIIFQINKNRDCGWCFCEGSAIDHELFILRKMSFIEPGHPLIEIGT